MSLFAELKRRKVFRVAVVYAATAFVVLQAADIMLPRMGVPEWAMGLLVAFVVFGFPIALVLAWALELTPDGLKRTESVPVAQADQVPTPALLGKRTMIVAGLLVVLGIGLSAGWLLKSSSPEPIEPVAVSDSGTATVPARTDVERPPEAMPTAERESIAVLPFVNMSPDPENAFFADGISEELLNILAGIDGLKVASRTSAFSFKGSNTPIPEIARQLGVRHILEGSVRKQGNRVRITAQLIEAGGDAHLWSERYDRDLDDIFQVQEEIAQAITSALEGVLGVRRVTVEAPTRDLVAYERFLRGRTLFYQRLALDEAIDDLQFVVDRDPEFAEAWAFLGAATGVVGGGGYETRSDREELRSRAELAVQRALELDPTIPLALAGRGRHHIDLRTSAGIAEGLKLLERAASGVHPDSSPRLWFGLSLAELGYVESALPLFESARDQDPMVHINHGYLGYAYAVMGREREAERSVFRGLELQPRLGNYWVLQLAIGAANRGETERASALITSLAEQSGDHPSSEMWAAQVAALQDPARRKDLLDFMSAESEIGPAPLITSSLLFGDADRLFDAVERATESGVNIMRLSAWLPGLGWLREDPRYFEFMRARGAVSYWEAHGFPTGCRAVDSEAGHRLDCTERGP